jgi:hypothetical protein
MDRAMAKTGTITMSMRDFDRLKTIQAVADGNLRAITAASRLQLTRRQVDRYRADGATGLVSRKRGQRHHQLSSDIANMAPRPLSGFWADAACEKLREVHGLVLAKETVRKLMSDAGLWIPRRLRSSSIYRASRFTSFGKWRHASLCRSSLRGIPSCC